MRKDVTEVSNKVSMSLDLMSFEVKFLEDTIPKKIDLVLTEARNLLQSLILIEDINTYHTDSHLRYMLKAHAWKIEMQGTVVEVDCIVARNEVKTFRMLCGLELTSKFLDDGFEDQVATLGPPAT